jgi:hypothetical protein
MPKATDERRRSPRASLDTTVQLRLQGEIQQAQLVDIGPGGLRLTGTEQLAESTHLTVFLPIESCDRPKQRLHLVSGDVVWSDDQRGTGIRFERVSASMLGEICELVTCESSCPSRSKAGCRRIRT